MSLSSNLKEDRLLVAASEADYKSHIYGDFNPVSLQTTCNTQICALAKYLA